MHDEQRRQTGVALAGSLWDSGYSVLRSLLAGVRGVAGDPEVPRPTAGPPGGWTAYRLSSSTWAMMSRRVSKRSAAVAMLDIPTTVMTAAMMTVAAIAGRA